VSEITGNSTSALRLFRLVNPYVKIEKLQVSIEFRDSKKDLKTFEFTAVLERVELYRSPRASLCEQK